MYAFGLAPAYSERFSPRLAGSHCSIRTQRPIPFVLRGRPFSGVHRQPHVAVGFWTPHERTQTTMLRVGIEIHARIKTDAKLFSQASALVRDPGFGQAPIPNSQVAFLDCSLPGAMPKLNPACVKQAVLTGLAVNGSIQPVSVFERKHYFYCDQPLGFQITQQSLPIVRGGGGQTLGKPGHGSVEQNSVGAGYWEVDALW
ncbi:hypothetical protein BASA81_010005 [Batrachochytrium salamandrivorans]|nr:hypothetical protein BASA81_010005 [Batrachochytrium salamandrivorans]